MTGVTITVNGTAHSAEIEDRTLLVEFLRGTLGLTGTHVGCDTTQCGACTVILDGKAVKSCTVLAVMADGAKVRTVEGLAEGERLHPVQQAFCDHHALQCGFCTPGMLMAAVNILERHGSRVTEEIVRHELEGNLCRCTGYHNIIKAVMAAADRMTVAAE